MVAENRRARHDYFIEETFEAGMALTGTEVKSLRGGRSTIAESYAADEGGEIWLVNANIPEYARATASTTSRAGRASCCCTQADRPADRRDPARGPHRHAAEALFQPRGRAKVEIALAKGKKPHDKRQAIKDRDWQRQRAKLMSDRR